MSSAKKKHANKSRNSYIFWILLSLTPLIFLSFAIWRVYDDKNTVVLYEDVANNCRWNKENYTATEAMNNIKKITIKSSEYSTYLKTAKKEGRCLYINSSGSVAIIPRTDNFDNVISVWTDGNTCSYGNEGGSLQNSDWQESRVEITNLNSYVTSLEDERQCYWLHEKP